MDKNFDTIMQWWTGHPHLCPIIQWAALTRQIPGYQGTANDTKVSTVWNSGKLSHITSKIIKAALCNGLVAYNEAKQQIFKHKAGTHSIQSGVAMAMYLGGYRHSKSC
jgi:hypothetical protein